MHTLQQTKRLILWRQILIGFAIFFTLTPLSFTFQFGANGWAATWAWAGTPLVALLMGVLAIACWVGVGMIGRRTRGSL